MFRIFSALLRLNLIKTISVNGLNLFKRKKIIIFFGSSKVHCKSTSSFTLGPTAKLFLNRSWSGSHPFPFFLSMEEGSVIFCSGDFSFYEGGQIGISKDAKLYLGSGYINKNVTINCRHEIRIGNNVAIGPNVVIRDSDDHCIRNEGMQSIVHDKVCICDNVWIGTNSVILKGVTIGAGSVIAAGSIVTKNVPSNSLAAGVPARIIKTGISWE